MQDQAGFAGKAAGVAAASEAAEAGATASEQAFHRTLLGFCLRRVLVKYLSKCRRQLLARLPPMRSTHFPGPVFLCLVRCQPTTFPVLQERRRAGFGCGRRRWCRHRRSGRFSSGTAASSAGSAISHLHISFAVRTRIAAAAAAVAAAGEMNIEQLPAPSSPGFDRAKAPGAANGLTLEQIAALASTAGWSERALV